MPYELRNTLAALACNFFVNGIVIWRFLHLHSSGAFDGPNALALFGQTVLWTIPLAIIATIVMSILFNIVIAIVMREPKPEFIADERDQMFKMRSMVVTMIAVSAGFICAMIALALGWSALSVFIMIYFAFALGDLLGNVVKGLSYVHGG